MASYVTEGQFASSADEFIVSTTPIPADPPATPTAPAAPTGLTISAPTLQGQTLAGNYLAMTRGGSR